MIYDAKLTNIAPSSVEEELIIEVNGIRLCVFSSSYPTGRMVEGNTYQVELELTVLDDYLLEISDDKIGFQRINNSFAYEIVGILNNGKLIVNDIVFFDEFLETKFSFYDGKKVKVLVDRITLYFVD